MKPTGRIQIAKDFSFDAIEYAILKTAILGLPNSGKSYTAMKIGEQLMDNNIPIIAFDPSGVWWSLKLGVNGNKGYPIVVAGGDHADIPLTRNSAKDIVAAAMKENISVVLDLSGEETALKADWIKIVQECIHLLFYNNKQYGIRHIFLEEGSEFCPQRIMPNQTQVYSEIERLARIGRNKKLGLTVINQRAAEINKTVHEICNFNILHNQDGKNSLKSIQDWFMYKREKQNKEIMETLPTMDSGTCWVVGNRIEPQKIQVLPRNTFHPDPMSMEAEIPASAKKANVSEFVKKLNEQLEKVKKEQEEKISSKSNKSSVDSAEIKQLRESNKFLADDNKSKIHQIATLADENTMLWSFISEQGQRLIEFTGKRATNSVKTAGKGVMALLESENNEKSTSEADKYAPKAYKSTNYVDSGSENIPIGEKSIMIACRQYPDGLLRNQLTVLTGYKRSSRDTYIQRLTQKGWLEITGAERRVSITDSGISALGSSYEPLPKGRKLQEYWLSNLPAGEATILKLLIDAYPKPVDRDYISSNTPYQRSSRDTYLQRMAAKEIIDIPSKGAVKASSTLFM